MPFYTAVHGNWEKIPNGFLGQVNALVYKFVGVAYNPDTNQLVQISDEELTTTFNPYYNPGNVPEPGAVWKNEGDALHYECTGALIDPTNPEGTGNRVNYAATVTRYHRNDTLYQTQETDVQQCGYLPPDTRSCNLVVVDVAVAYDVATVTVDKAVGPLEYSLDGGANRQSSDEFKGLTAGRYAVTVFDLGATLPGCNAVKNFTVSEEAPATAGPVSVNQLSEFCFVGNPVLVQALAAEPLHSVVLQIWCEQGHRSGQYALAYEAQRRSNAQAEVSLEISDVLRAQLAPELNLAPGWSTLTRPLMNWFVRVAAVLPQSGQPGPYVTSTNSVAVLGGLAPEPIQGLGDYWGQVRPRRLVQSWQPRRKRVGADHVELVTVLSHEDAPVKVTVTAYNQFGAPLPPGRAVPTYRPPVAPPLSEPAPGVVPPELSDAQRVRLAQLVLRAGDYPAAGRLDVQPTQPVLAGNPAVPGPVQQLDVLAGAAPRLLIYQNSLGAFDTLALHGKLTAKFSADPQVVEAYVPLRAGLPATRQERSWPGTPSTASYSLSTGWLPADWLEYLPELVQPGRQVFEYFSSLLRPVVLTTKELIVYQETDGLNSAVIDYRAATRSDYYTDYARNTNRNGNAGAGW